MSQTNNAQAASSVQVLKQYKGRSMAQETLRRLFKNRGAIVGMCFLILLVIAALLSGVIFDYNTQIIGMDPMSIYAAPSAAHPFGCDNMGRDILARICYGARYSLLIGMGSVLIGLAIGIILGSLAGFHVEINPFTAMAVGFLGLPGAALVAALTLLL